MPHIKSFTRFLPSNGDSSLPELAWVVIGSHNVSMQAWGMLCYNGAALKVSSFEMSILATPALEAAFLSHPHRHVWVSRD
jgi:Tyrosyl-DNA phosphodiesterase